MANTDILFQNTKFLDMYPLKYVLRNEFQQEVVTIDLVTGKLTKENQQQQQEKIQTIPIKAVYGIVELEKSNYLIVATKSNMIGSIYQKNIFSATAFEFYPICADKIKKAQDNIYIEMMQTLFRTNTFYFSDDYDLTSSFQRFVKNQVDKNKYNPCFCYNECFLNEFIKIGAYEWISPFINGFISIQYCAIGLQFQCDFVLITRRDKRRTGMRFLSRGTDLDGNPTNQAETEQIIILQKDQETSIFSFVQTRGSMPFKWQQKPNLKWSPKGYILGQYTDNIEFCRKHFEDQQSQYQKQVLVNLVDKKGTQLMLGNYYQKLVNELQNKNLRYIWFDFHHECAKMKWEHLSKLIDQIKDDINQMGYFELSYNKNKPNNPTVKNQQKGVVRTNCMDCLDRTNVVQSVIARNILHEIFYKAQVLPKPNGSAFEKFNEKFEEIFRINWSRNADVISILYTGTGALKTDFTSMIQITIFRTGKRTIQGALQDGKNAIMRYILGNFYDPQKQDQYDLLLGKINPRKKSYKKPGFNPLFFVTIFLIISGYLFYILYDHYYDCLFGPSCGPDCQQNQNLQNIVDSEQFSIKRIFGKYFSIISGLIILCFLVQKLNKVILPKPLNSQ